MKLCLCFDWQLFPQLTVKLYKIAEKQKKKNNTEKKKNDKK